MDQAQKDLSQLGGNLKDLGPVTFDGPEIEGGNSEADLQLRSLAQHATAENCDATQQSRTEQRDGTRFRNLRDFRELVRHKANGRKAVGVTRYADVFGRSNLTVRGEYLVVSKLDQPLVRGV